ncbi:MAG: DNA polymerase III subunit alpha, partial [Myxococcales bacterium]|nr:DNA polymerase III subunit alpha [Myxococcales bacterium]
FNKSHSAAYGLITYHTGYLKHHYPVAFMAALMTCDKHNNDNVVKFIAEARAMDITVLQPDVNESGRDFSVVRRPLTPEQVEELTKQRRRVPTDAAGRDVEELIRFGLGAVRNVGETAVDSILAAREQDGAFKNIFDLCRRVDLKRVNKRTLEGLTYAGAFDGVCEEQHRAGVMAAIESAVEQGQSAQRDRESGQNSLFAVLGTPTAEYVERYPEVEEWDPRQKLLHEREALGFYLTGHPLDRFQQDIERHATCRTGELSIKHDNTDVRIAGVICEFKEIQTKSGKGPMCFFQVEDQFGRVEGIVFPKSYARVDDEERGETFGDRLQKIGDDPVLVTGCVEVETNEEGEVARTKLLVDSVLTLKAVRAESTSKLLLAVELEQLSQSRHDKLKLLVAHFSGTCPLELRVTKRDRFATRIVFGDSFRVAPDDKLLHELEKLFGTGSTQLVQTGEISLPELNNDARARSRRSRNRRPRKAG